MAAYENAKSSFCFCRLFRVKAAKWIIPTKSDYPEYIIEGQQQRHLGRNVRDNFFLAAQAVKVSYMFLHHLLNKPNKGHRGKQRLTLWPLLRHFKFYNQR